MKVIVAIDQSPNWKQVVEAVVKRRWPKDTVFRVLTVVTPIEWQDFEALENNGVLQQLAKLRDKHAEEILDQARKIIDEGVLDCSVHAELRRGSPRGQIIDAAAEWMPDKIVMGAHGKMPNRLLPATTSRSVVEYASCTVELVRLKPGVVASEGRDTKAKSKV